MTILFKNALPAGCALLLLVTQAQGQNQLATKASQGALPLEEVFVTSSRVQMPLRQIGTSVSILESEEIRQRGFNSLFDLLRSEPAIGVTNNGGAGKATALRIRGEEGFRTQLYIDGIDASDAGGTQIGPRWEHLLSQGVQRVEILRGSQGLMYGGDAGGVVSVSTRRERDGFEASFSGEAGRYGTRQYGADMGFSDGRFDATLIATHFENDGFSSLTPGAVASDDDGYENTTLHGRAGWNVNEQLRLEVVARDVDSDNDFDDCFTVDTFSPSDNCSDDYEQSAYRASVHYDSGRLGHVLSYDRNDTDRNSYTAGQLAFFSEGEMERFEYLGNFKWSDQLRFVYGAETQNEQLDDGTFDRDRDQQGYYLEGQINASDSLFVTAGARLDDNDDFGDHTSYRVSAAYVMSLAAGDLKFKSAIGTGFRAPSLYEIAYNDSFFATPPASDVNLSEEKSEGYDLGVAYYGNSGLYLEANYFMQTIEDEIFFDLVAFSGYLQGDGDSESSGIELIGEYSLTPALTLSGNYTWNEAENEDNEDRVRRPEHLANLGLDWRGLQGDLVIGLNMRLSREAIDGVGADLDDYEVYDLNASYQVTPALQVYGRVENILDEDYVEARAFSSTPPRDYNVTGAAGYAGVRYTFQ